MGVHGQLEETGVSDAALQHARLQELIAAFADGELARDEMRVVEAHLLHCAECRRELELQQGVSRALAADPGVPPASAALRRRIEWMGEPVADDGDRGGSRLRRWAAPSLAAAALLAIAGGTAVHRGRTPDALGDIAVVRDAIADCRRVTARNFPRKPDLHALAEGLQFAIPVLDRPELELFSTWKTTVGGAPAAALAYRWRGIVVVEYAFPAELMRSEPAMGKALESAGFYARSELGQGVVALLRDGSATLLVADAPPEELRRLIL